MKNLRIFTFLFLYFAVFLGVFLVSFFLLPDHGILPNFHSGYSFNKALVVFSENFLFIHCTLIVYYFSLFSRKGELISGTFQKFLNRSLFFFLAVSFLFTLLYETTVPSSTGRINEIIMKSEKAQEIKEEALSYFNQKNYEKAQERADQYFRIDSNNKEVIELRNLINLELLKAGQEKPDQSGVNGTKSTGIPAIMEILDRAEKALFDQEYLDAYYLSSQVLQIEKENERAGRIASKAWEKLSDFSAISAADQETAKFLTKKTDALQYLMEGNDVIGAYNRLLALHNERPLDVEINEYLGMAEEALKKSTFSREDALTALELPGYEDIFFLDGADTATKAAVFMEKAVPFGEAFFAKNVKIIEIPQNTWRQYDLALIKSSIILFSAVSISGEGTVTPYRTASSGDDGFYSLRMPFTAILEITGSVRNPEFYSFVALMGDRADASNIGFSSRVYSETIAVYISMPFIIIIFSLFAVGFTWKTAPPGGASVFRFIVFFPLVPLFMYIVVAVFEIVQKLCFTFIFNIFAFLPGLLTAVAVNVIFLILAFLFVAGERHKFTGNPE